MHFNLRQKMAIIVGAVAISFAFLTAATWFLDRKMEDQTRVIRDQYIPLVELSYRLDTEFDGISLSLRDAVSAQDTSGLESALNMENKLLSELDSASKILDPKQSAFLRQAVKDYFSIATDTSKRLIGGETGLSIVESMTMMQAKRSIAESALNKVTAFDRGKLSDAFASIFLAQKRSARIRFWISFSCVFFLFIVSALIVRSLMLRLREISKGLNRFGTGDFQHPIPIMGNDELSELSQQVNRMAERILSLLREIESFSYSVAHDLRAPLRSVLGFSGALVEDHQQSLSDDGKALVGRIVSAAQRMEQMVDGLLGLSRLNRAILKRENVDLSKITHEVIEVLTGNDPDRNVTCNIEEGVAAWGDPKLLDVVMSNLVGNAWKFTKRMPSAQIQFGHKKEEGLVVFFVRDNGAGFDMRYSAQLFGTFQRLHSNEEFEGHGIGLATVKNIVDKHGGRIWAESEVDKGTTFYFTLS